MTLPNLPASVLARLELTPIEDIMLHILREAFPDMPVHSLIEKATLFPSVVVRRSRGLGEWNGDPRFTDSAYIEVEVFTQDPDGDEAGALVSEAIRVAMREAWLSHQNVPGMGSIIEIRMIDEPRRVTDWATSTGPVQYADLPTGVWRYETRYSVSVRRPQATTTPPITTSEAPLPSEETYPATA